VWILTNDEGIIRAVCEDYHAAMRIADKLELAGKVDDPYYKIYVDQYDLVDGDD
jgi:glutathione peroxidase-family protein